MDYKNAGVDIEAGYKSVELMKEHVKGTMRPEVLGGIGGFSGAFSMSAFKDMEKPTLVSGTDGVGTKLKLAFLMDKHNTVGIDCVAMCVNDIACAGGEPLFWLYPYYEADIIKETAKEEGIELKEGVYLQLTGPSYESPSEVSMCRTLGAVGVVDEKNLITGKDLKAGDVLIGMASSGVHSNGFSLVRKVFEMTKESLDTYYDELGGTLGETLIAPTKIYVKALKSVKDSGVTIKACSHVTGGGFYENIPRMLPDGVRAVIKKDSYEVPAIFKLLAEKGSIEEEMMYNTYNMGIGMVLVVDPSKVDTAMKAIREAGEIPYVIGYTEAGEKGVTLC